MSSMQVMNKRLEATSDTHPVPRVLCVYIESAKTCKPREAGRDVTQKARTRDNPVIVALFSITHACPRRRREKLLRARTCGHCMHVKASLDPSAADRTTTIRAGSRGWESLWKHQQVEAPHLAEVMAALEQADAVSPTFGVGLCKLRHDLQVKLARHVYCFVCQDGLDGHQRVDAIGGQPQLVRRRHDSRKDAFVL